jgi:hypothetical protein
MSEYSEEEYDERVATFNELLTDYTLHWSNFFETAQTMQATTPEGEIPSVSLAEVWFKCPACEESGGAEQMYLLQRNKETGDVVMQSLSTFFDVLPDGSYSGIESIFDLGASEVVMACRACVTQYGHDPDSVEIIMPEFTETKLV